MPTTVKYAVISIFLHDELFLEQLQGKDSHGIHAFKTILNSKISNRIFLF
jgi:hypothetical protein